MLMLIQSNKFEARLTSSLTATFYVCFTFPLIMQGHVVKVVQTPARFRESLQIPMLALVKKTKNRV